MKATCYRPEFEVADKRPLIRCLTPILGQPQHKLIFRIRPRTTSYGSVCSERNNCNEVDLGQVHSREKSESETQSSIGQMVIPALGATCELQASISVCGKKNGLGFPQGLSI